MTEEQMKAYVKKVKLLPKKFGKFLIKYCPESSFKSPRRFL